MLLAGWFSKETWVLIAAVIALIWYRIHRKLELFKRLNIPDSDSGFLGYKTMQRFSKDARHVLFKLDIEKRKKFGDVYATYSFLTPIVTVWDPKILKQIYIKDFGNFRERKTNMRGIQGDINEGLTEIAGEQWKRVRNTISPAFSSSKLKQMLPLVNRCGDKLIENMKTIVNQKNGIFDPKSTLSRYTMDTICSASFSGDFHVQEGEEEPKSIKHIRETFAKPLFQSPAVLAILFFPWLEPILEKMDYSIFGKKFRSIMEGMFKAGISNRSSRTDILQLMLKAEISSEEAKTSTKGLTRREIAGNSQLMLLAGYETTSTALTLLIYNLAMNQRCQDKLREEIQTVVMDKYDGTLCYEAINEMKYLDMCIEESLRLYPPAPMNQRVCEKDITINGYHFVEGLYIQIPLFGMGRDPEYWSEPEVYKPERMEDMSQIDPMIHQPFGGGPRNCIGKRFAVMVLKDSICKILSNFQVVPTENTPAQPLELDFGATVKSRDYIELKVEAL